MFFFLLLLFLFLLCCSCLFVVFFGIVIWLLAYGVQGKKCDGLNENVSTQAHLFECLVHS